MPTKDDYVSLITTTYGIANSTAGSTKLRSAPLDFAYAGYYDYGNGSAYTTGSYGYFWSRTAFYSSDAYTLYISSNTVNPQNRVSRGYGYAVRCTAK